MILYAVLLVATFDSTLGLSLPPKTNRRIPPPTKVAMTTSGSMLSRRSSLVISGNNAILAFASFVLPQQHRDVAHAADGYNYNAPEERSGLVVLRVAEVAQYQERLIRAILNGGINNVVISPPQIVFGTQLLLRNSNLAGNLKVMIETEIPRARQREARQRAATTMNTVQAISSTAAAVQRPFTDLELLQIADLYRDVRLQLNALYECLTDSEKDKYYGYFVQVTEYEKKLAEGTYNPELDGILRFDYDKADSAKK